MQYRDYISSKDSATKVFGFIRERLGEFEKSKWNNGGQASPLEEEFRNQIVVSFPKIIMIDDMEAFKLIDEFFRDDQQKILDSISEHPEE
jgi:hypothetical protein